jgi:hypothetical protein
MYCSHLSMLQEILTEEKIKQLEKFFAAQIGSAADNITVTKVKKALDIPASVASKVLTKCKEAGVVTASYAIRCPECNMLIKKVDSLAELPTGRFVCYGCDEEIEITPADIEIIYAIVDKGVFIEGQQYECDKSARAVVHEDSMESIFLAGSINEYLFSPTEEEYLHLKKMYSSIKSRKGTTKKIGDSLEDLVKELFNLCPIFRAAGIKTSTNQIDCCVTNKMFIGYGVLNTIGERFFIECKNESKTPSGGYMSKLHSIIDNTNAGGKTQCVKFGIIVSKEKGPSTFKALAIKNYLSEGIVMISICGDEIEELIDNRGNLLELIDRKASEIMLDATIDLKEAGLYTD